MSRNIFNGKLGKFGKKYCKKMQNSAELSDFAFFNSDATCCKLCHGLKGADYKTPHISFSLCVLGEPDVDNR